MLLLMEVLKQKCTAHCAPIPLNASRGKQELTFTPLI